VPACTPKNTWNTDNRHPETESRIFMKFILEGRWSGSPIRDFCPRLQKHMTLRMKVKVKSEDGRG
jgi:hypothetical protein